MPNGDPRDGFFYPTLNTLYDVVALVIDSHEEETLEHRQTDTHLDSQNTMNVKQLALSLSLSLPLSLSLSLSLCELITQLEWTRRNISQYRYQTQTSQA